MGEVVSGDSIGQRLAWMAVDLLTRALDRDEQDAARGDLAESNASASRALREIAGLVVRRQVSLWTTWRPWVATLGIAIPIGLVLSYTSLSFAHSSAIYGYLYVNNWTWEHLKTSGARRTLVEIGASLALRALALIAWSWTAGQAVGMLSRKSTILTGPVLLVLVLAASSGAATTATSGNGGNAVVFAHTFYRVVLPWLVPLCLVLGPAVWALHYTSRQPALSLGRTVWCTLMVVVLTALNAKGVEDAVRLLAARLVGPSAYAFRPPAALLYVVMWPALYVAAAAGQQRRRQAAVTER